MSMLKVSTLKYVFVIGAVLALAACDQPGGSSSSSSSSSSSGAKQVAEGPNLGVELTHADLADWDIAIGPDGAGLPPGEGSVAQGKALYLPHCSYCHGQNGEGGPADRLVGGIGSLATDQPVKTVGSYWPYATTLFDFIRRFMPLNFPQSLTDDQVYALSAYILHMNGIVGEDAVMNAETLPAVEMPNKDGFVQVWPRTLDDAMGFAGSK